jgi:hypothetical protein
MKWTKIVLYVRHCTLPLLWRDKLSTMKVGLDLSDIISISDMRCILYC